MSTGEAGAHDLGVCAKQAPRDLTNGLQKNVLGEVRAAATGHKANAAGLLIMRQILERFS